MVAPPPKPEVEDSVVDRVTQQVKKVDVPKELVLMRQKMLSTTMEVVKAEALVTVGTKFVTMGQKTGKEVP